MKLIFLLLACCVAVALAGSDRGKEEDRLREKSMEECRNEMKLTEEEAKDPSKLACLYECMHKKVGYFNADGSPNIERIAGGPFDPRFREVVLGAYRTCVEKAKGDSCQVAFCLETTKIY